MDRSLVDEIKERVSLVDIISRYVRLTPGGKNLKGLCPFHGEKSPSFYVSPTEGYWKCFGCGKGGDVIAFVQEIEKVSFREALQSLADTAGITIRARNPAEVQAEDSVTGLYKVLSDAKNHYVASLRKNTAAQSYLHKRGVTDSSIEKFAIGLADDAWQGVSHALEQKYGAEACLASGISIQGNRGVYDRFRSRIMFPTFDVRDRTITFSGRLWSADGTFVTERDTSGKYINGPETTIYKKSRTLYGMAQARTACNQKHRVVIVEGHLDCVMSHQAGLTETVAVAGTALTAEHAQVLKRFCDHAILCFDGDDAGQKATARTLPILYDAGFTVDVARMPSGQDPADVIAQDPSRFLAAIESASDYVDSRISSLQMNHVALRDAERILRDEVYPLLVHMVNPLLIDEAVSKIAYYLGVASDAVRQHITDERARKAAATGTASSSHGDTGSPDQTRRIMTADEQLLLSWTMVAQADPESSARVATYLLETLGIAATNPQEFANIRGLEYANHQLSYEWLYGGLLPIDSLPLDVNRFARKYIADQLQEAAFAMNSASVETRQQCEAEFIKLTSRSHTIQQHPYV